MSLSKGTTVVLNDISYSLCSQIQGDDKSAVWTASGADKREDYVVKFVKVEGEKRTRFEKEIDFCVNARHQHIVRVYGYSEHDGCLFYVMPRYDKTLRNVINEETNPFKLLEYIIQLCNGIQYIHSNSAIHRDIKPENIFVDQTSNLVIADFGIAHFEDSTQTKAGAWMGNKRYAAPEQTDQNKSNLVTCACDIYALGRIINELYTKSNPAGTQYTTIADAYPLFLPLDKIVYRCLIHDPAIRPNIEDVLTDILLVKKEITSELEAVRDLLKPDADVDFAEEEIERIVLQASQDVLAAQNILYHLSDDKWDSLNYRFHSNLLFNVDATIRNLYFQRKAFDYCSKKFNYEANVYKEGDRYAPINLKKKKNLELYNLLVELLKLHPVPDDFVDLSGRILKFFSSCCDYHCRELLSSIFAIEKQILALDESPVFHLIRVLKDLLESDELRELALAGHLSICWEKTTLGTDSIEEIFLNVVDENHIKILEELKKRFSVLYGKLDPKHYYVKFTSRTSYDQFTTLALSLPKPHYLFEGDVLSIIRVQREAGEIIELEPLDDFDITYTLAKILGLRNDY